MNMNVHLLVNVYSLIACVRSLFRVFVTSILHSYVCLDSEPVCLCVLFRACRCENVCMCVCVLDFLRVCTCMYVCVSVCVVCPLMVLNESPSRSLESLFYFMLKW